MSSMKDEAMLEKVVCQGTVKKLGHWGVPSQHGAGSLV